MMNMDKISVIIPVYRVEKYLRRCVDSVLAQSYANLEVILVDDGSPDNSGAICDEYAEKDSRVRVIHQNNAGAAVARNAGLAHATGTYISFIDSDDYIDVSMLESLLRVLLENDADISECGYRWVKPNVTYDRENTGIIDIYTNLEALEKLYFGDQMFGGLSVVVWNKLYRAELAKSIRFAEGFTMEDCLYTPMVYYKAKRIAKLNTNLYNFYFSENSVSRSEYNLRKCDGGEIYTRLMAFYKQEHLDRYYQKVQNSYFNGLFYNYYECRLRKKKCEYRDMAKKLRQEIQTQIPEMLTNPFSKGGAWRYRLFHISSGCWFAVMWAGKKFKHYRWLIRHKIGQLKQNAAGNSQ